MSLHASYVPKADATTHSSRFVYQGELGRGGMARVFRAFDQKTQRLVALKRLIKESAEDLHAERKLRLFQQEFHTLRTLSHPRIVQVFDYGQDEQGAFYTMEVLQGSDLRCPTPVPWHEACRIARDVVSSLAILHHRHLIHRDVTPRNIIVDDFGQAKLLDFGAMCPMGRGGEVVGTPPFVAPEVLQQSALDGRTDLYALGATLYYCLTGRHAYPAKHLSTLRDCFRSPVPSVRQLNSEVPEGLSDLVMELLSLSAVARPQNAAVVFERLIALAALPREEELEVSSAYLSSPVLVGRQRAQTRARVHLLKAFQGRGRTLMLTGDGGVGRSRMLDALAVEATLLGAQVIRGEAIENSTEFSLVRDMIAHIVEGQDRRLALPPLVEQLLAGRHFPVREREEAAAVFSDFIANSALSSRAAVLVDDAHLADEPSLAVLVALSAKTAKRRFLLVVTANRAALHSAEGALPVLAQSSREVVLERLSQQDVRTLLESMLGQADNLTTLTEVLYAQSEGNPTQIMAAMQGLVDLGTIQYEAGAWKLPPSRHALLAGLPREADLISKLQALGPLCYTLSALRTLDIHGELPLNACTELVATTDEALFSALTTLVDARLLTRQGERYRFLRPSYAETLRATIPAEERGPLHRRLATFYAGLGHISAHAHHALLSGQLEVATRLMLTPESDPAWQRCKGDASTIVTLEALVAEYDREDPPRPCALPLRARLLQLCVDGEDMLRITLQANATVRALAERCGLQDYQALTDLSGDARLTEGIARAEARQKARFAHHGVESGPELSVLEALTQLPRALLAAAGAAVLNGDAEMLTDVPSLAPFYPLSAALIVIDRMTVAMRAHCEERLDYSLSEMRAIEALLNGDEHGLDPQTQHDLSQFCLAFLQGFESMLAMPSVLRRRPQSNSRSNARHERELYLYYLAIGDTDQAEAAHKRHEQLRIQGGVAHPFPTAWDAEYSLHGLLGHFSGLKRCEHEAERIAVTLPRWQARVELSQLCQAIWSGKSEALLERATNLRKRLPHHTGERRQSLYLEVMALLGLGRPEACRELVIAETAALGRPPAWHDGHLMLLGMAESALGHHERARELTSQHLALYHEAGIGGILLGRQCEICAEVALAAGDEQAFNLYAEWCATHYQAGHNPVLTGRYEAMLRKARQRQLTLAPSLHQVDSASQTSVSELEQRLQTALSTCIDDSARSERALSMVTSRIDALGAQLYLAHEAGLTSVARIGDLPPAELVDDYVQGHWSEALDLDDMQTALLPEADPTAPEGELTGALELDGMHVRAFLLTYDTDGLQRACGLLVVSSPGNRPTAPGRELLNALAKLMANEPGVRGVPV